MWRCLNYEGQFICCNEQQSLDPSKNDGPSSTRIYYVTKMSPFDVTVTMLFVLVVSLPNLLVLPDSKFYYGLGIWGAISVLYRRGVLPHTLGWFVAFKTDRDGLLNDKDVSLLFQLFCSRLWLNPSRHHQHLVYMFWVEEDGECHGDFVDCRNDVYLSENDYMVSLLLASATTEPIPFIDRHVVSKWSRYH